MSRDQGHLFVVHGRVQHLHRDVLQESRDTGQLVFGKMVGEDDTFYIGRRRVRDENNDPVVVSPADDRSLRTVSQTAPEELDRAVTPCVRDAVTAYDAVLTAVRTVFGWRRAGADIQSAVLAAIDRCLRACSLTRKSTGALRASR